VNLYTLVPELGMPLQFHVVHWTKWSGSLGLFGECDCLRLRNCCFGVRDEDPRRFEASVGWLVVHVASMPLDLVLKH
jgi:hypothetical protein